MCPRDPVGYVAGGLLPTGRVYHGTDKEPFRRLLRVTRAPPGGRPGESAQDTVPGGQPLAHGPSLGTAPRGTWAHPPLGPPRIGGVVGVGCSMYLVLAKRPSQTNQCS